MNAFAQLVFQSSRLRYSIGFSSTARQRKRLQDRAKDGLLFCNFLRRGVSALSRAQKEKVRARDLDILELVWPIESHLAGGVENIKALEMVFRKAQSRQSISPRKAEKASEFLGLLADAWAQETMLMLEKRS